MSDARWFEVDADIDAAIDHFQRSVALYQKGGFEAPGLDGYQAQMALMHGLQSAHTSLEQGLLRILEMLGEERPVGENWHADLIRRVSTALPDKRPAILRGDYADAADETRRFRHRAACTYDTFRIQEAKRTIEAAELLGSGLKREVVAFRNLIDPD